MTIRARGTHTVTAKSGLRLGNARPEIIAHC